ncbi:MAG TPA: GNAT family N-acetyltransferase [Pyrinomonadaceae bacterium]|nr:GNAT family N-acetyltransferase [Pyrinomonadaceae bacterium]
MKIREATLEDADALIEFNQAMALETEGIRLDPEKISAGVRAVFEGDRRGFYLVAEEAGEIVGGLMVTYEWSDWRNAWFWWIQSVYVVPEARGKQLYAAMYGRVKEMAAAKGDVCGFRLYVERENERAQRVYKKVGMTASHYVMFEEVVV